MGLTHIYKLKWLLMPGVVENILHVILNLLDIWKCVGFCFWFDKLSSNPSLII